MTRVRIEVSRAAAREAKRVLQDDLFFETDPRTKKRLGAVLTVLARALGLKEGTN